MMRQARTLPLLVLTALGYFLCARLSYAWAIQPARVVIVWFPSGFTLALLALVERRLWPFVLAGAMAGNLTADLLQSLSAPVALAAALANGLESLVAGSVLTRLAGSPVTPTRLRDVLALGVGAVGVSNALTALAGALMITLAYHTPYWTAWFVWWTGDGMGMLIVTPAVLSAAAIAAGRMQTPRRTATETIVVFISLTILAQLILSHEPDPTSALSPNPYMLLPLMFWAAARFAMPGATAATLVVCVVTVWNASQGVGPFAQSGQSATNEVLQIYLFLALASLTSLVSAAILNESHKAERTRTLLASILDSAPDFVTIAPMSGSPLYVNPAARLAFGIGDNEPVESLFAFRRPGFAQHLENVILPAAMSDGSWSGETEYIARSGRVIPVSQVTIVQRRADAGGVWVSTISRDISERLRTEEALRTTEERKRFALEAAGVGVWEANLTTGAMYWSSTCERMHGLAPGTFGGSVEAFLACIQEADRPSVEAQIECSTGAHVDTALEYHIAWPDGTVRLIGSTGRTVYDATGAPVRAAGIVIDVTDRRSLEDQLRQAQKMEAIGQLAGGVAHDFNNLLTAILGHAEFALEDLPAGDRCRRDLEAIRAAGQRAAQLTQQLLAFSRHQILAPRVLHIGDVVSGVVPLLRRLLGETIEIRVTTSDRWLAKADAGQIEQVIINLAINARDAMPDGGRLTIETGDVRLDDTYVKQQHALISPGPYVMVAVSDSGHGMDAQTQKRIFEPFFTTKAQGKGTGLGLATVYGIVKQSNGYVWVYSEPGHGTTFKVYLPRTEELETAAETPPAAARTLDGHETILVVEDEEGVRELVSIVLGRRGYAVIAVAGPQQAIRRSEEHSDVIDLILTDVVLPGMSGRSMVAHLRPRHPEAKVVYMSGYTNDAIVHHGVLDPGTWFLQKPFTGDALLRKVRDRLDADD